MNELPLIVLNWKTNPDTEKQAKKIFTQTKILSRKAKAILVVCPPFPYLLPLGKLGHSKKIFLAAQDIATIPSGAETGAVGPEILLGCGVRIVIVGHSERRALGETNIIVNRKLINALKGGLSPILCVGERERDHGVWYLHEVKKQLEECLVGVPKKELRRVMVAYEPVWAIGTNATREASPEESEEMAIYIKKVLTDLYDAKTANTVKILYGGSVDEVNARMFLESGGVAGLLVGRASLDPKKIAMMTS